MIFLSGTGLMGCGLLVDSGFKENTNQLAFHPDNFCRNREKGFSCFRFSNAWIGTQNLRQRRR